jgi:hypothetical protein
MISSNCPSISVSAFLLEAQRYKAFDESGKEVALTPVSESLIVEFFTNTESFSNQKIKRLQNRGISSICDDKQQKRVSLKELLNV